MSHSRMMNYPVARANANTQMPFQFQAPQNGNYASNYPMVPIERGPVHMRNNNHDFFKNQWGVPDDLAQMMTSTPNIQPMDLIAQYKGRELVVPSQHLTAAILNAEASFLSEVVAPMFPTHEFNFTSSYKEMNQVEFTRIAAMGVPNQQTFRTTSWHDTMQKMQLDGQIELQYALDPLLGEKEWLFQLAGMASNAMLTIHKTIGYATVSIAFSNLLGLYVKNSPGDLSKLLMATEDFFAIAARDPVKYLRMIQRFVHTIPGLDLVLTEFGTTIYANELLGESESMRGQKTILDPTTGELMWKFTQGKKSIGTLNYGDIKIKFAEMPNLKVNMDDDNSEQPLRTSVTLAELYPPNPNNKATDTIIPRASNNDIEIYQQTKNQGDIVKISIVDAYGACFYYGRDGSLSDYAEAFCAEKNQQIIGNDSLLPFEYNNTLNKNFDSKAQDFNQDSPYDNDTPNMDYIRGKETLESMRGWRERFFGVTYIPTLRLFRLPKRIADFERWAIPDSRILQCAKTILAHAAAHGRVDFNAMINETHNLLDEIDNEPWKVEYVNALIAANPDTTRSIHKRPDSSNRFKKAADVKEFAANENGSLNIPKRDKGINGMHPAGFGFGGGLVTYAKEAGNDTSGWREGALRAERVVSFWEMVAELIEQYIGKSDMIDPTLTPIHFQAESRITVLIDSTRHHSAPVFLAAPGKGGVKFGATADRQGHAIDVLIAMGATIPNLTWLTREKEPLFRKLIGYVENNIIAPYEKDTTVKFERQLASLAYVADKLRDAKNEDEIRVVAVNLDLFMQPGKDKKSADDAKKLYDSEVGNTYGTNGLAAKAVLANPVVFNGPTEWVRAPLVAGNRIFEAGVEAFVRPADPYRFYEVPLEINAAVDKNPSLIHPSFAATTKHGRFDATSLSSLPYSQLFHQNYGTGGGEGRGEKRTDIFTESLVSKKSKGRGAMDVSSFLAGGRGFAARDFDDMDVEQEAGRYREKHDRRGYNPDLEFDVKPTYNKKDRKEMDDKMEEFLSTKEYFGPWKGRFNYMNKHISSPILKVLFKAILLTENSLSIHVKLASLGLKLMNVLLFRLFIQHIMSSTIVMQSLTSIECAISRTTVFSSLEKRGIITINGGFYLGIVRRNPQNIQMMPYTHPVGFVGGMGTDFLRHPRQFRNKVNEKGSIIAIPSTITEQTYEYPLHFLGLPTFTRKDIDNAPHNRKWSSCEFAKFLFDESMLFDAEAHIREHKKQHGYSYDVSFCVARGATRYINPSDPSGTFKMIPGTGARGDPCMNNTTAYKTFNGDTLHFPEYAYDHALRI